jgi:hypothetical protein
MLFFTKKTCQICRSTARMRGGFRVPDRLDAFICNACYQAWERAGRTCAECHDPVRGPHEIGAFVDRRVLGHADCGALKMFAA